MHVVREDKDSDLEVVVGTGRTRGCREQNDVGFDQKGSRGLSELT